MIKQHWTMPHFMELRKRIVFCALYFFIMFFVGYVFSDFLYGVALRPLNLISDVVMMQTGLAEVFVTYISIAYYFALFMTVPVFFNQLYLFLAPALYKNEKRIVLPFLLAGPVLFITGVLFMYYAVMPNAISFLISFQHNKFFDIMLAPKISEYIKMFLHMMVAFGVAFQTPVLLVLLVRCGLITVVQLKRYRRFAIVILFFLSAIITPPDVISQIFLAIPLILLYECSIVVCSRLES